MQQSKADHRHRAQAVLDFIFTAVLEDDIPPGLKYVLEYLRCVKHEH